MVLGSGPAAKVGAAIALVLMAALWLAPIAWALVTSLKTEPDAAAVGDGWIPAHGFTGSAYGKIFSQGNIPTWALNSFIVAAAVTVLTVTVSALAAYGFSRTLFRGRKVLFAATIASIMVPPQILIVPLFREMLSLNLVDTYAGMILPQVVAPPMVYILKKFFDAIPRELEEAARLDGASNARVFLSVVLPLSRPILSAVAIFVFIGAWNNFLWPFISTSKQYLMTLPVGLATVKDSYGLQYAQLAASGLLASIPLILVFMIFQRQMVKSVATTGLGGQ
ncbi:MULTISPECIES: carbohydrate ABC transporter permease [unclassified Streptomyces]|uniref:carbohydrate ABC transporter permease n=2 Tax=unclassified Streptomyces TaxID=2593676 RepID=UPI001F29023E|nr:carbohydrate ABC transporter permease [Streptomyces sp. HmicA12]